ncbi:MAG: maleylpyruvate isomerase family mycothiol-dependent enzyme [Actinobacteria bacterium]|nr:maleylpyruvate isomerase family mycothiol-dependent enzyme [Actinomycetota bacterium]
MSSRPDEMIAAAIASHERLLATVDRLGDAEVSAPTRLPRWSRGHVLTKIALSADSHRWLFDGALAGEVRDQYPIAGMRERDIESGAARSVEEMRDDLRESFRLLVSAWNALSDDMWNRNGRVIPGERPMHEIVFRFFREVEVHHLDLDVGYEIDNWPDLYVDGEMLRRLVRWLLDRGPAPELAPW